MIRADIEEQVRMAKYCVRIDHRHEACETLGHELIRVTALLEKLQNPPAKRWHCSLCGYLGDTGPVHPHPRAQSGVLCPQQAESKS